MIQGKYVLFIRIPIYVNNEKFYCDQLWEKDLRLHLSYIEHFSLCCPVVNTNSIENLVDISDLDIKNIYTLNEDKNKLSALINMPQHFYRVAQALRSSDIAHSDGSSWPFPLSLYLLLLRPFIRFKWVVVIEATFWMLRQDEKVTIRKYINHHFHTILMRLCVKYADAKIFVQSFYKEYFLLDDTNHKYMINNASWVDQDIVIEEEELNKKLGKVNFDSEIKIIFPVRLEELKGVYILFDAIEILAHKTNHKFHITMMGEGTLKQECIDFCEKSYGDVTVEYKIPVSYGKPFFDFLRNFDILLVTNLTEEQPRIIFDAFSQGLAIVASATSGVKDVTTDKTAVLFERANANDLVEKLISLVDNQKGYEKIVRNAHSDIKNLTHQKMHQNREQFLTDVLS